MAKLDFFKILSPENCFKLIRNLSAIKCALAKS